MKRILLVLSLLFLPCCGLFTENHRELVYRLENGKEVKLTMYEENYPLAKGKILRVYLNGYTLEGKSCEDPEAKKIADEIWTEVAKKDNLSAVYSGGIRILRRQTEAIPEFCDYPYSRKGNGEWSKNL